jgi:hypothetical protein
MFPDASGLCNTGACRGRKNMRKAVLRDREKSAYGYSYFHYQLRVDELQPRDHDSVGKALAWAVLAH